MRRLETSSMAYGVAIRSAWLRATIVVEAIFEWRSRPDRTIVFPRGRPREALS